MACAAGVGGCADAAGVDFGDGEGVEFVIGGVQTAAGETVLDGFDGGLGGGSLGGGRPEMRPFFVEGAEEGLGGEGGGG